MFVWKQRTPASTLRAIRSRSSTSGFIAPSVRTAGRTASAHVLGAAADAQDEQPTVGMTLTTHRPDFDLDRLTECRRNVVRWLRRDLGHGDVEYLSMIEWNRRRMPHAHLLLKGLPDDALGGQVQDPRQARGRNRYRLEIELRERWETWTGGAWVVDVRPLRSAGGAVAYVVGHHHKRDQAPPAGVRNAKRFQSSRGYFNPRIGDKRTARTGVQTSTLQVLRERARETMRREAIDRSALAKLVALDVPQEERERVLEALLEAAQGDGRPIPVEVLGDGRMRHLSTGEIFDGPAREIHARAAAVR